MAKPRSFPMKPCTGRAWRVLRSHKPRLKPPEVSTKPLPVASTRAALSRTETEEGEPSIKGCSEFLARTDSAQMLDLPVLRPSLVPQLVCLQPRKADRPEQNSFSTSLAWNTEELCRDQLMFEIRCSSLTSSVFSVVLSWAVCQGKGTALVCLGRE